NLDRPELLEPVRKNLGMMQCLVHPDGAVVTDYSHRQDYRADALLAPYYRAYRWMASLDENAEFAAMAEWAKALGGRADWVDHSAFPQLFKDVPAARLPESYRVLLGRDVPPQPDLARVFHYDRPRRRYTSGARIFRMR